MHRGGVKLKLFSVGSGFYRSGFYRGTLRGGFRWVLRQGVLRAEENISISTMSDIFPMRVFNYEFRSQTDFSKILSILPNLV